MIWDTLFVEVTMLNTQYGTFTQHTQNISEVIKSIFSHVPVDFYSAITFI